MEGNFREMFETVESLYAERDNLQADLKEAQAESGKIPIE